jgi:DNA repair exonuclease SbcCD nuclease subunit
MNVCFLHTSDWQIGKPFAGIQDVQKRSQVQRERLGVLDRIGRAAREHAAEFIVVTGDLFDSPRATKPDVSAVCAAIGKMQLPVAVIPGNHDHGGPGCLWEQLFFRREQAELAPNLRILLQPEPVELGQAVLFPCPLLRRHEARDTTEWLRTPDPAWSRFGERPRIVLAHGSVQGFGARDDEEDMDPSAANLLDLSRLRPGIFDYIALGDWHGRKQVGPLAWYAGTPEFDRFAKGDENDPGHVLVVTATRGALPQVEPVRTGRLGWHQVFHAFSDDASVDQLKDQVDTLIAGRALQDLMLLEVEGSLGLKAATRLDELLEAWEARLLRLKLVNRTVVAPTDAEIEALTQRAEDPLIARVAGRLVQEAAGSGATAEVARVALRELHAACLKKT